MSSLFDRSLLDYLSTSTVAVVTGSVGILVTVLAVVLLAERELVGASPSRRRRLIALDAVLVPLLVAFVAVVVTRFHGMSY